MVVNSDIVNRAYETAADGSNPLANTYYMSIRIVAGVEITPRGHQLRIHIEIP